MGIHPKKQATQSFVSDTKDFIAFKILYDIFPFPYSHNLTEIRIRNMKKAPLSSSLKDAVAFMVYGYTPRPYGCQYPKKFFFARAAKKHFRSRSEHMPSENFFSGY